MEAVNNFSKISANALVFAESEIGQMEVPKGSNKGPMVDKYLASVGLNPGFAWCQAFVHWCYEQAAAGCGDNPVVKTAGVLDCWNRTATTKKVFALEAKAKPELLEAGMQFIMTFGHGTGHTGIIESVDVAKRTIHTIEGNSNNDGSREGYAVVRHERRIDDVHFCGFIRYS
jgi:hypothetical protein